MEPILTMYAVKSKDGKWLRAKGYCGSGKSWVTSLQAAKLYGRPGPARAQITFWAKHYPKFGIPDLVELRITEMVVLDESAMVKNKIHKSEVRIEQEKLREAKWELEEAEKKRNELTKRISDLKRKYGPTKSDEKDPVTWSNQ